MQNEELVRSVTERAEKWLGPQYDEETRAEVKAFDRGGGQDSAYRCFHKDPEFRTGGPRESWEPVPTE